MLNSVYQLVAPRRFELTIRDEFVGSTSLIVRPTHLSICNADQRYYQGTRGAHVLAEKLPMALIHEGVGEVVVDRTGKYTPGTRVVMIPNLPCEHDSVIAENYLRSSRFRGSSADGFMQELIVTNHDRVVLLPDEVRGDVAAFTELVSVIAHIVDRFHRIAHERRGRVGFWGDGNVGFIGSLLYKKQFPNSEVVVFGRNADKLSDFTFADSTYLTNAIPEDLTVDHAFECAGGTGSVSAIDQIINFIRPEGTIALCGVSENPAAINTRMVLEKGLRLFGSSRSGRADYIRTLELYRKHPEIVVYLQRLVIQAIEVRTVANMMEAFEADIRKHLGKTIIHWNK